MSRHMAVLGTLTIPINTQESNILQKATYGQLEAIVFYNASAYTGTVAVEVHYDADAVAASHAALSSNGSAITLTAGIVQRFDVNGFKSIMLDSTQNEAAARAVVVVGIFDI